MHHAIEWLATYWPWLIGVTLVSWLVQNALHEGSHVLMGYLIEGRKPEVFRPFPGYLHGRFVFAYYQMGRAEKTGSAAPRHLAPFVAGILWALTWAGLGGAQIAAERPWGVLLFVPAVCGLIDALFWGWGYLWGSKDCDGKRYREIRRLG